MLDCLIFKDKKLVWRFLGPSNLLRSPQLSVVSDCSFADDHTCTGYSTECSDSEADDSDNTTQRGTRHAAEIGHLLKKSLSSVSAVILTWCLFVCCGCGYCWLQNVTSLSEGTYFHCSCISLGLFGQSFPFIRVAERVWVGGRWRWGGLPRRPGQSARQSGGDRASGVGGRMGCGPSSAFTKVAQVSIWIAVSFADRRARLKGRGRLRRS